MPPHAKRSSHTRRYHSSDVKGGGVGWGSRCYYIKEERSRLVVVYNVFSKTLHRIRKVGDWQMKVI